MKKNEIKKTIEYKSYLRALIIFIVIYLSLLVITISSFSYIGILNGNENLGSIILLIFVLDSIISLPFIIFFLIQLIEIIFIGKKMEIMEVELFNPFFGIYGIAHFKVEINKNGKTYQVTNKEGFRGKLLNKYNNKRVKIGFSNEYEYFYIIEEGEND